jgi:hypothetical protein
MSADATRAALSRRCAAAAAAPHLDSRRELLERELLLLDHLRLHLHLPRKVLQLTLQPLVALGLDTPAHSLRRAMGRT